MSEAPASGTRRVAYLTNLYPAPSHSFIRREIAALEALGWEVHRFSHRACEIAHLSEADAREKAKTRVLVDTPGRGVLAAVVSCVIARPWASARTVWLAAKMARKSNAGFATHLGYVVLACVLSREMRALHCTHVHAHFGTNPAAVAMLLHRLSGLRYSLTFHGPHEFVLPDRLALPEKIASAEFVAMVSQAALELFRERHPAWAVKGVLVPCGLDRGWTSLADAPVPPRPRLVSVARLDAQKNPLLLIDAAALLQRRGVEFELILLGDGEFRAAVEARIAQHGLANRVTVFGWATQDEVREHLQAARALVLSSDDEGLPVAIMEAYAMGRPVIATDVGSVRELVETGVTGWLVPPRDAQALANAMMLAVSLPSEQLGALGRSGRARLESHDVNRSAAILSNLFEREPR